MYLDDATDHFTVTNNVIWGIVGTSGNQCIFSKGIGNRIENNILIMGPKNDGGIASMEMGGTNAATTSICAIFSSWRTCTRASIALSTGATIA